MGMPKESPLRAAAAVRYALQSFSEDGHVGCPEPIVVDETRAITGNTIPLEVITQAIETCRLDGEIVRDTPPPDLGPLSEDPWLYLKSMFLAELNVARAIIKLKTGGHPLPKVDVRRELELVARQMKIELAPAQREAIKAATEQKILVITGGPGTGKSTIVRGIVEIFQSKGQRIALCAPTGRAAKRLSESTRMEAKTIHRLLEFDPGTASFRRERGNLLEVDLLVVDEVSMVDIVLMNQLLRAIPPWACVIFVGDVDQLPSVGPGTVLADMIDSGVVPVVCLTEIFRQAGQSWIVQAAHAVNHAEEPVSAPAGGGDFYIIEADTPEIIIDRIVTMVRDRIPARFGFDPFRDVQILTPMNKSELGVASLNKHMQEVLNPKKGTDEVTRFGTTFREGDKVLQTRNNYTKEVFNGDIGRITDVHPDDQELLVDFDGRAVLYEFNELDELTLAYATSIHKSQGSEYPVVIMPVHTQHWVMLQRNLLYTGITRGKKLVVLVGSRKALRIAINKIDTSTRYSLLRWRLQETKAARDESTTED
jgi:exodeoxyribonuclease V alpha subunit